jgi:hypothetical protein
MPSGIILKDVLLVDGIVTRMEGEMVRTPMAIATGGLPD